ncbi:tRNA lysidine(34) synthetase TilS [Pararhizobium sp. DWP1-1-3]|uniref:tRNA lysidine(34) synthetase TilS n=1 Tax=Pararhizobium sp. DWP1-1-3 TaxID=2804652 RepID=UPI003CEA6F0A
MPAEADRAAPHAAIDAAKRFLSTFKTPGLIMAAVSGGSDSKGLVLALHEAITLGGFSAFSLAACTVDHALRSESAEEARDVAAFCAEKGIPHTIRQWSGDKPATGIQAAARAARYGLLADAAQGMGALCIVTAHTADDQNETIVMRQSRSDPNAPGLAGMAAGVLVDRRAWVWRPFLHVCRADIRAFLAARGEGWFDDPSNSNRRFERVRVRQALNESGPSSADMLAAGRARLGSSERAALLVARYVQGFEGLVARVDPALSANMADPDGARALMSIAAVVGGRHHLAGRETAVRLAAFLRDADGGRMTAGRVVFDRRKSGLYLYREARGLRQMELQPGERALWDGRFLVSNTGLDSVAVHAGGETAGLRARLIAAGLPQPVAKRAVKSAIHFSAMAEVSSPSDAAAPLQPTPCVQTHISLYDTFLPCFDLMMANSIATLFGRDRYLAPPVHDVLTEKSG